ncbi:MAG: DUF4278 domain-containing protein [Heteroscytonema crispum UTEX LB 1556]
MKLTYRGIDYENDPLGVNLIPGEVGGKYRGANWRHNYVRHIPVQPPATNLKYRGVAYHLGEGQDVEATVCQRQCSHPDMASIYRRTKVADEFSNSHLVSIRRNLEKRLQVAKDKGDERLIGLLEDEGRQLV